MYRATLLPSLDFGDTAAFQDAGGALEITPRQGYPLYFAIGNLVVWLAGREPAFGMNLASALCAALACGLLTWLAADLTGLDCRPASSPARSSRARIPSGRRRSSRRSTRCTC